MAALDFPNAPTVGQISTLTNGYTYQWDGTVWIPAGTSPGQAAGGDLSGTYPNPAVTPAAKSKWAAGATLTPVGAFANLLALDATGNLTLAGALFCGSGSRAIAIANLYQHSLNEVGIPGADLTKPNWRYGVSASSDNYFMQRAPANTTAFVSEFTLDGSGNLTINGPNATKSAGTTWANPSDIRLKRDVTPYVRGLADILALDPIAYRLKSAPDRECYGFDAAKVREVFPECVSTTRMKLDPTDDEETDDVLVFDMHPILVALVNAVKELANERNPTTN